MHVITHMWCYSQMALHAGGTTHSITGRWHYMQATLHTGSYTQVTLDACDYTHVVLFTDGTACRWHYTQHYRQVALHAGDTPHR